MDWLEASPAASAPVAEPEPLADVSFDDEPLAEVESAEARRSKNSTHCRRRLSQKLKLWIGWKNRPPLPLLLQSLNRSPIWALTTSRSLKWHPPKLSRSRLRMKTLPRFQPPPRKMQT